eukprot:TRINITY_DN6596_c0_g1_i4.p1 TRINITY_DN6596_c0_g1~~TRINITY_DN6596_c0_g1_i4.p1  ORF type:complete len:149 (+),score=29.35 TRINITY_DN6596_c0_g1_i4:80-526(+)
MFTNRSKEEILKYFREFSAFGYARSGFKTDQDFVIKEGPLNQFPHSMELHLRKLGVPTELRAGVIYCRYDFTVCKEGDILTPENARILELFDIKLAKFIVEPKCFWSNGKFEVLETTLDAAKTNKEQNSEKKLTKGQNDVTMFETGNK